MATLTPFLWFSQTAREAIAFYRTVFGDQMTDSVSDLSEEVMLAHVTILGRDLLFMNAPSQHAFNESFSLSIGCVTQAEIDHYWEGLLEGGSALACGWLRDRFGLAWQIVPNCLGELMAHPDPVKRAKVHEVVLGSIKFDLAQIRAAGE